MRDDIDFSADNYAELQETGKQLKAVYPFGYVFYDKIADRRRAKQV